MKDEFSQFNVETYLERLGLNRERPTLDYLKRIQKRNLASIPFENLDIHYGGRIVLDINRIFSKIMSSARGGYCFEINGLLYQLLKRLKYDCYVTAACFPEEDGTYSHPLDHMLIIVKMEDEEYIVDAGLIDGIISPKRIKVGETTLDYNRYFKFEKNVDGEYLLQKSSDQILFKTFYKFEMKEYQLIQFLDINDRHQDHPDSYFVKNKIISKIDENGGRITLTGTKLKLNQEGRLNETEILNEDEFSVKLKQFFNIDIKDLSQK